MSEAIEHRSGIWSQAFTKALVWNFVWINTSEIVRYFAVLRGMMQASFSQIPDVAPMNVPVFLSWSVWDTLLIFAATGFSRLYLERFGNTVRNAVAAGTAIWCAVFVLLWLGLLNMRMATPGILAAMLPWAWAEMIIAALIVLWWRRKQHLLMT
jgi:hypothetical protein